MTDVHVPDPDRILIQTPAGNVQAWASKSGGDVVVCAGFTLSPSNGADGHASFAQFMTVADARSLGNALLKAADHAEALLARKAA